jgi:hypothetical protein
MQVHQIDIAEGSQMKNVKSTIKYPLQDFEVFGDVSSKHLSSSPIARVTETVFEDSSPFANRKGSSKGRCRKIRFRDRQEAIEVLHRIERYRGYSEEEGRVLTHRNEKRAYKCPICLGAHLTSQATTREVVENVAA